MQTSKIERTMFNIVADDVGAVSNFYMQLLSFEQTFVSDWYVVMVPKDGPRLELGIIARTSDVTPHASANRPGGGYLTFVVENVLFAFEQAKVMNADIIEPPTDMDYGQRRMILRDPAGTVIDISSPTPTMTA
ncbi:MAG: VOC family protein [Rhizobiaceae bacterium]|nr:VOC family protein [Rhizobiaceae bacterium]